MACTTRSALLVLVLAGSLAACNGGGGGEGATPSPGATATPSETQEPSEPADTGRKVDKQPAQYEVKRGDTLSEIAVRFNTTVQRLVKLNDLDSPHEIREGQRLKLPSGD